DMAEQQPLYQRIAEDLRAAITTGALPAGSVLPPARELIERYGTTKSTVERAISVIRSEGLVESRQGRDTRVRRRPPIRRVSSERYRVDAGPQDASAPQTSFTAERGLPWEQYRLDVSYDWIEADERLA